MTGRVQLDEEVLRGLVERLMLENRRLKTENRMAVTQLVRRDDDVAALRRQLAVAQSQVAALLQHASWAGCVA
jgi:hypothetical protein